MPIVRVNISVPDKLKKRMDRAADFYKINWSELAAQAFEAKLSELSISESKLGWKPYPRRTTKIAKTTPTKGTP